MIDEKKFIEDIKAKADEEFLGLNTSITLGDLIEWIEDLPKVEVLRVISTVDIYKEVGEPPEWYIKEKLAYGLAEELEKFITFEKRVDDFRRATVYRTHIELVNWRGEDNDDSK